MSHMGSYGPKDWAQLMDNFSNTMEREGLTQAFLYSAGFLNKYDTDTLRLNSDHTIYDKGDRLGRVRGESTDGEDLDTLMQVAIEDPDQMPEDHVMAIMEEKEPSYESGRMISYTLLPEGYEDIEEGKIHEITQSDVEDNIDAFDPQDNDISPI